MNIKITTSNNETVIVPDQSARSLKMAAELLEYSGYSETPFLRLHYQALGGNENWVGCLVEPTDEPLSVIAKIAESAELDPLETDQDTGAAWRNGEVTNPITGETISMGGGWVESEESADMANEEAGIAGGLRQGVWYPNETVVGQFTPYKYGEDESGWQAEIMPSIYGDGWEDHPDAEDTSEEIFKAVQAELRRQAD